MSFGGLGGAMGQAGGSATGGGGGLSSGGGRSWDFGGINSLPQMGQAQTGYSVPWWRWGLDALTTVLYPPLGLALFGRDAIKMAKNPSVNPTISLNGGISQGLAGYGLSTGTSPQRAMVPTQTPAGSTPTRGAPTRGLVSMLAAPQRGNSASGIRRMWLPSSDFRW